MTAVPAGSDRVSASASAVRAGRSILCVATRWRVLIGMVVAIVAVAGAVVFVVLRGNGSTPVGRGRALDRYRALQGSAPATGVPAPGVYTYATSGWECAGVGSLCLRRSLPHRASVIVARHGALLTIETDLSAQHLEAQRYRVTARGRVLVWQRTRISILGVTQDDAHSIAPPTTLALPARLFTGERWTQRFTDQSLPVSGTNVVVAAAPVTVAGARLPAWRIVSTSVTGGAHPGTERDVAWHSARLGLDLRFTISRRIGGTFPYRLRASARLLSVRPAT
jgi:hypothetical protein